MATNWSPTMPRRSTAVLDGFHRAVAQLTSWYGRARERRALAELDERMLRDIGITPAEARIEALKPFWER